MTRWKNSVFATAAALGLFAAAGLGLVSSPVALAQPADAGTAIDNHYSEKGGANSPLGQKVGGVYAFGSQGAAQDFQGGKIIWSPDTGAKVMYGAILDKYLALGGADAVGYPTNDESDAPVAGTARFSEFSAPDGATIAWSPQNGASLVRGPIRTAWSHLHATDGVLGAPLTDTTVENGVYTQRFAGQNGAPVDIRWSAAEGFVTTPPDIAGQLAGLDVSTPGAAPGAVAPAPAPEANAPVADSSSSASKWWALPLGLAIAAVAGGLVAWMTKGAGRSAHSTATRTTAAGTTVAGSNAANMKTAASTTAANMRRAGSHLASAAERSRGIPRPGGA